MHVATNNTVDLDDRKEGLENETNIVVQKRIGTYTIRG